eukprot:7343058-Alexandrium_andersonii.AAC.1
MARCVPGRRRPRPISAGHGSGRSGRSTQHVLEMSISNGLSDPGFPGSLKQCQNDLCDPGFPRSLRPF